MRRRARRQYMVGYAAKYTKISRGCMGQIVEWPEVVTEGKDIEECRVMLRDALNEMILAYEQAGRFVSQGSPLYEQLSADVKDVRKTA